MAICSNCGFDVKDSKFCPQCGSKVVIEKSDSICPNCGAEVGESKFCPECGTKIKIENQEKLCPNCGEKVGENAFCANCGTKIGTDSQNNFCKNCGKELNTPSNFCPYCGWSEESDSKSISDKMFEADKVISKKLSKTFKKSKSFDKLMNHSAEIRLKHTNDEDYINFYARNEPICLEVYNEIEDPFLKTIFVIEREKLGSVGGGAVGSAISAVYTPTKDMNPDEARQFYRDLVDNIVNEIENEKRQGTFNQEQFYKRKVKESRLDNFSMLGGLKAIKKLRE